MESAILAVIDALAASADHLTRLDQAVGDGDLGISLARGAGAVREDLTAYPLDDAAGTLEALGETLQRSLGGSSGPFYAVALFRAARRLREGRADDPVAWSAAFRDGCAGISELGGAGAGDRTMLDALIPAAEAFDAALKAGRSLPESLRDAATAAEEGARRTSSLLPRKGRSSYLGDRALGHVDPGAQAAAIWLRALADRIGAQAGERAP